MSLRFDHKEESKSDFYQNQTTLEKTNQSTSLPREKLVDFPLFIAGIGNREWSHMPLADYLQKQTEADITILQTNLLKAEHRIYLITMLCNMLAYEAGLAKKLTPDAYLTLFEAMVRAHSKEQTDYSDPIVSFVAHAFNETKQDFSAYQEEYRTYVSEYLLQHKEFMQQVEKTKKDIKTELQLLSANDAMTEQKKSALEKQLNPISEANPDDILFILSQSQLDRAAFDPLWIIKRKEKISQFKLMQWIANICLKAPVVQGISLLARALQQHKNLFFVTSVNAGSVPGSSHDRTSTYDMLIPSCEFQGAKECDAGEYLLVLCTTPEDAEKKHTHRQSSAYGVLLEPAPTSDAVLQPTKYPIKSYRFQPASSHQLNPLADVWRHFLFTEAAHATHQHITQSLPYTIKGESFYWAWLRFLLGPQSMDTQHNDAKAKIKLGKEEAKIDLEQHKKMALNSIPYQLRLAALTAYRCFYQRKYQNELLEKYKRDPDQHVHAESKLELEEAIVETNPPFAKESLDFDPKVAQALLQNTLTEANAGAFPIDKCFFTAPILVWPSGRTYEEKQLKEWEQKVIAGKKTFLDPVTKKTITHCQRNHQLEKVINDLAKFSCSAPYWQKVFKVLLAGGTYSTREIDYHVMVSHLQQMKLPICPLSKQPIRTPVVNQEGIVYEASSLAKHPEFKEKTVLDYALHELLKMIYIIIDANCDVVVRPSPLNEKALENLFCMMKSGAAYVRCGDQLFYVSKICRTSNELKISQPLIARFDEDLNPKGTLRTLTPAELKKITTWTKHAHTLPPLVKQPLNLVENLYWGVANHIQPQLNEQLAYYELCDAPNAEGAWLPTSAYEARILPLQAKLHTEMRAALEESAGAKGLLLQVPEHYKVFLISPMDKALSKVKENSIVLQQSGVHTITAYAMNKGKIMIEKVESILTEAHKAILKFPTEDILLQVTDPSLVSHLIQALPIANEREELEKELQDRLIAKKKQLCSDYADKMMIYENLYHDGLSADLSDRTLERQVWVDYFDKKIEKEMKAVSAGVNKELKEKIKKENSIYISLMMREMEKELTRVYYSYRHSCATTEKEAKNEKDQVVDRKTQQLAKYKKFSQPWHQSFSRLPVSPTAAPAVVESKEELTTSLLSAETEVSDSRENKFMRDKVQIQSIQELIATLGFDNLMGGFESPGQCVPARVSSSRGGGGYTLLHMASAHYKDSFELSSKKKQSENKIEEIIHLLLLCGVDPFRIDPKGQMLSSEKWNWGTSKVTLRQPLPTEFSNNLRQALWSYVDEKEKKMRYTWRNIILWIRGRFDSNDINEKRQHLVKELIDLLYQKQKLDTIIHDKTKELLGSLPKGSKLAARIGPIMASYRQDEYPIMMIRKAKKEDQDDVKEGIKAAGHDAKVQEAYDQLKVQLSRTEQKFSEMQEKQEAKTARALEEASRAREEAAQADAKLSEMQQKHEAEVAQMREEAARAQTEAARAQTEATRAQTEATRAQTEAARAQTEATQARAEVAALMQRFELVMQRMQERPQSHSSPPARADEAKTDTPAETLNQSGASSSAFFRPK